MKIVASLFAVFLCAGSLLAQDGANFRKADDPGKNSSDRKEMSAASGNAAAGVGVNGSKKTSRDATVATASGEDSVAIKSTVPASSSVDPVVVWTLIQSGGWAMVPLAILSVLTVMLVLVYLFTLRRSAILTPNYMNTADLLLKKRDYLGLLAISNRHSEAVARVVQRTLDFATKNPGATFDIVKEIAQTEGQSQAASLQHRTVYLADIGMLSPMIGLLGTVVGIIRSFGVLGSNKVTVSSRDLLLAAGVSEALVATAVGLVLGIVAMGFYSLFRNRVQSLISDLEIASAHILALVAINYNKKRDSSRVVADEEF